MGSLAQFRVKLSGGKESVITLLAETAIIAIYRAATLALETGSRDFEIVRGLPERF